jgi:uncharacterized protein YdeI (BOF family)
MRNEGALTQANYEAVARGMSFDAVCELLGEPNSLSDEAKATLEPGIFVSALDTDVYEWRDGEKMIRVLFTNRTVNDKAAFNLE